MLWLWLCVKMKTRVLSRYFEKKGALYMATVKCGHCGAFIDEDSKFCPECGEPNNPARAKYCNKCGRPIPDGMDFCPYCSNHKESTREKPKKKSKWWILIVLALIVAAVFYVRQEIYYSNMIDAANEMINSGVKAEEAGGQIISVWQNCVFQTDDAETDKYTKHLDSNGNSVFYDDFNDAIDNLYADRQFNNKMTDIASSQAKVQELMRSLSNPPRKHQAAYDALREIYSEYISFTNLVLNPSGNLESYLPSFNDADESFAKSLNLLDMYFERISD